MVLKPPPKQTSKSNIIWMDPKDLKPYKNNAKIHSAAHVKKIAGSIEAYGPLNPIIIDRENTIIAGHGRLKAALLLSMSKFPVMMAEHLSPAQVKAYRIADNKTAEDAKWDERLLAIEIEALTLDSPELDITLTGFEMGEIDVLLGQAAELSDSDEPDPADLLPETDDTLPPVSELDDLWVLDEHRVLCGNALKPESYTKLMAGEKVAMVASDSPYNVPIAGHVSGNGKVQHREFAMATGEMSSPEFTNFLETSFSLSAGVSQDGAIHYWFMDWRHVLELLLAGKNVYSELKNICVWVKTSGGMGSQYRSQHELVFVYKHGTAPHINNVQLGKFGRNRTNIWNYPGVNSFGKGRDEALAMHPTVKPVAMVKDAILDSSNRGDIILDPFLGSGTTLIAAEQTGRRCYGMELDPLYVDTIIRRWQTLTGGQAVHAETGMTFDDMALELLSDTQGGSDV